ncbi:MAG: hypothetical protein WC022_00690 [Parcubacteria group bacterium]
MLYSIIPPALVVLSLVGIIIILMKKAPQMARLEDNKNLFSEEERKERELSARYAALKRENRKSFKEFFLATITGIVGALKGLGLFFIRFFGSGKAALRKINDDAKAKIEARGAAKKHPRQEEAQNDFFRRRADRQIRIADEERYAPEELQEELERAASASQKEEKKAEKKDLFEKILIDRIASNPKDIEAYERLGEYYLEIENWEYGKECFKQVIKLNPRNINARSRMRKLEKILSKR